MTDAVDSPKAKVPLRQRARWFRHNRWVYCTHLVALLMPGVEAEPHEAHKTEPASLDDWSDPDRERMIEEGRRQADRQLSDLKEVRGRAQWLFAIGAAVTVAIGGAFRADGPTGIRLVLFLASLLLVVYGLGGAAAIMAVRADFKTIDTAVLSHKPRPTVKYLAAAYSRMLREGENTVATRIAIFREAVVWMIAGGYLGLLAALV